MVDQYSVPVDITRFTRNAIHTVTGQSAEVILLDCPASSMPGEDFSMAFLLLDGHPIDWVSCWTYNRTATQKIQLEDIDGDGNLDLAFRYGPGWWGTLDERKNTLPGDNRTWLYAYRITSHGFESIFPITERKLPIKVVCDPGNQPIRFKVVGLPSVIRENKIMEIAIRATNLSNTALPLEKNGWMSLDSEPSGSFLTYQDQPQRKTLAPGKTVSYRLWLVIFHQPKASEVVLRWSFVRPPSSDEN